MFRFYLKFLLVGLLNGAFAFAGVESSVVLSTQNVEFRIYDKNRCNGCYSWFVSFLNINTDVDIEGAFQHANLAGDSFLVYGDVRPLEAAYEVLKIYGIWDSVICKGGYIDLFRNKKGEYSLMVRDLADCATEWND